MALIMKNNHQKPLERYSLLLTGSENYTAHLGREGGRKGVIEGERGNRERGRERENRSRLEVLLSLGLRVGA